MTYTYQRMTQMSVIALDMQKVFQSMCVIRYLLLFTSDVPILSVRRQALFVSWIMTAATESLTHRMNTCTGQTQGVLDHQNFYGSGEWNAFIQVYAINEGDLSPGEYIACRVHSMA